MEITQVAKEIRAILKANFPKTKFSVKSSRFSMGSSVNTSWTDGPTTAQVDELIGHYGDSRSRFVGTSRKHSQELVIQAIAAWKKQNPQYAHLTVNCKGDTSWGFRAEFDLSEFNRGSFDLQDCERSLINDFIYGSTFDGTNLILPQENADDCESETVSVAEPEPVEEVTPEVQPQPSHVSPSEADALEAERKQIYTQYIASWQEMDELEAKLAAKRQEAEILGEKLEEVKARIEAKRLEKVRANRPPKATEITLTRAEGPSSESRKPIVVKTFAAADKVLRQWAKTAPDDGAYDKCDITLNLASGSVHKARFNLTRSHVFGSRLQEQLEKQLNTKLSSSDVSIWCGC